MSPEALEVKFLANCAYGGWNSDRSTRALALLRELPAERRVDLTALRD